MPITLIESMPHVERKLPSEQYLKISELFANSIQGEGIFMGQNATFLRLQGCTLCCSFCDTKAVWQEGNPYTITEILDLFQENGIIPLFRDGQHLVLTGGSVLKQEPAVIALIQKFIERFRFKPYIEIENEATCMPSHEMVEFVDCWNNSPKLASSGNAHSHRYKPDTLKYLSELKNSWFKFVCISIDDWMDIKINFLDTKLIKKSQLILMPEGGTRTELSTHRQMTVDLCTKFNVRYSDRLHIVVWDKKVGV